jgi:hypothetical protein
MNYEEILRAKLRRMLDAGGNTSLVDSALGSMTPERRARLRQLARLTLRSADPEMLTVMHSPEHAEALALLRKFADWKHDA